MRCKFKEPFYLIIKLRLSKLIRICSEKIWQIWFRRWDIWLRIRIREIVREKIKEKKKNRGGIPERKPFNRDTDLQVIRHDSKKIFSLVNDGDNSLSNRFKNSKWEKSFL